MKFRAEQFCRIYFWMLDGWIKVSFYVLSVVAFLGVTCSAVFSFTTFMHILHQFEADGNIVRWDVFDVMGRLVIFGSVIAAYFICGWIMDTGKATIKWLRGEPSV